MQAGFLPRLNKADNSGGHHHEQPKPAGAYHGSVSNTKAQSALRGFASLAVPGKEDKDKKKRKARLVDANSKGVHHGKKDGNKAGHGGTHVGKLRLQPRGSQHSVGGAAGSGRFMPQGQQLSSRASALAHRANSGRIPVPLSRASTARRGGPLSPRKSGAWSHRSGKRLFGSYYCSLEDIHHGVDGVRDDSRIGRLLNDFGGQDDWVSITVLKHQVATILQANIRGWLIRRRWWSNPEQVVLTLHARLHAESADADRRAKLRATLEQRALNSKQKKVANAVVTRLMGTKHHTVPAKGPSNTNMLSKVKSGAWSKLQKNTDIAVQEMLSEAQAAEQAVQDGLDPMLANIIGSDPDSEFSDLEMEDITAVKMRAKTPPWQRQEESQRVGQFHKLTRSTEHGSLEMRWDLEACMDRLDATRIRRRERNQDQAEQEAKDNTFDPTTQPLPPALIASMLYPQYQKRMVRLGLMDPSQLVEQQVGEGSDHDDDGQGDIEAGTSNAQAGTV